MVYVTRSTKKTCPHDWCTVHFGNWKRGPHADGKLVPTPVRPEALVVRMLHEDGRREAYITAYDRQARTWSAPLPLPARPRKPFAAAVSRAKAFVRTGALT